MKIIMIDQSVCGNGLCTATVQRAIDESANTGGGTIRFGKGEYTLGTVYLRSGVTVEIPEGTTLSGADFELFDPDEKTDYPLYQDVSHSFFHCSMFVAENCENIKITGRGIIDMRSKWDEKNVRDMVHRGAKTIALKKCKGVEISGLTILNTTDLAIYFAGCENVEIFDIKMRVHIDGISPDNSKNVNIRDCDIESGDDGIVLKSSYTLNELGKCENISVKNCKIKSRCNALKFGTETIGGFQDIDIENIDIRDTRISGIAIESVDGANINRITIKNVTMKNVNAPLFIHLGKRMRAPKGRQIGSIKNITVDGLTATGPYEPYRIIEWNYPSFKEKSTLQQPWDFAPPNEETPGSNAVPWQMTSNVCGLKGHPLENVTLKNISLEVDGGVKEYAKHVPENSRYDYPEVYAYGKILPAKGIYFRHINGLVFENVTVTALREDERKSFVFDDVSFMFGKLPEA